MPDRTETTHPGGRLLLAGAGVGVLAAWMLPGHPPGAGIALVAVAIAVAVAITGGASRGHIVHTVLFAGLSLTLAATPLLRDAPWLVAGNIALSLALASLSVSGGTKWDQIVEGVTRHARRIPASALLVWSTTRRAVGDERVGTLSPVARGVALGALLLVPFAILFMTADEAFARLATKVFVPEWDVGLLPLRAITFVAGLLVVCALALALADGPRQTTAEADGPDNPFGPRPPAIGITEWTIAIGLLDVLFAGFVLVQVAVLFGGHDRVLETSGLTYAEYARSGFVQLLIAATLTLGVVAAVARWARGSGTQRLVLRAGLGILCCLTIVILVSAIRRLGLYEEAFGFTRMRLFAHVLMLWLGGIFALIVGAAVVRSSWLPRATVAWTAVVAIGLTVVNPNAFIAARNVDRYRATGLLDVAYLSTLSADAVPALATLPPGLRDCALETIEAGLSDDHSIAAFNVARERARDVLSSLGDSTAECPSGYD